MKRLPAAGISPLLHGLHFLQLRTASCSGGPVSERFLIRLQAFMMFQVVLDFNQAHLVHPEQFLIAGLVAPQRLLGALLAAAHGPVGIRFTAQAAVDPDHHQRKCQAFRIILWKFADMIDKFEPNRPAIMAQMSDQLGGEQEFVKGIHSFAILCFSDFPC